RFNLLCEEFEGYSHLATELISAMGPATQPNNLSSPSIDFSGCPRTGLKAHCFVTGVQICTSSSESSSCMTYFHIFLLICKPSKNMSQTGDKSMANALDNSGFIGPYSKITTGKISEGTSASSSTKSKSLPNQKAELLLALLSISAINKSIFMLSIPNHQYLAHQDPNNSALLLRLIDVALNSAYLKKHTPAVLHINLKSVLSPSVIPCAASLRATIVKTEPVFFWSAWRNFILRVNNNAEFLDHVWPMLRFEVHS
ncbi:hypothetical protein VP01_6470g1, partial [Puccinia sorghi]